MSFAQRFAAGQQIAKGLMETYRTANMNREIDEVANAKAEQSQGFTAEDGEQMAAMAAAKKPDGTPYFTMQDNGRGGLQAQNNFEYAGQDGAPVAQGSVTPMSSKLVTDFMGKRTAGAMTDDQVSSKRATAMADVIGKYDPREGMRMKAEAKRGERDDQRFALEKAQGERAERTATEAEAEKNLMKTMEAQEGEAFKASLKNPDGSVRPATPDDYMASSQRRIAALTEAGKPEKALEIFKDYQAQAFSTIKLQEAQRDQALGKVGAALASGDLNAVKDFYNKFIPDGAKVTNVVRGADGQITISRVGLDGSAMPDTVMKDVGQLASGLAAFKDPMAVYTWSQNEFKNNLDLRKANNEDRRLNITEQRLNMAELRASGGGGGGGSGGAQPLGAQVGLKDRRDLLNDYGSLLPDARAALDPDQGKKIMDDNARRMEQADAIFSMNAGVGQVLTAPQILAAQQAAVGDPKNVKLMRDGETGAVYQTVMVSGKAVIVGQSRVKEAAPAAPVSAPASSPPKAVAPTQPAPNTPPEIAARMQRVIAAEQAGKADKAARTTADKDKKQALKAESSWLTTDAARTLRPSEAQKYLQAYGSVLDPALQRELRKRM